MMIVKGYQKTLNKVYETHCRLVINLFCCLCVESEWIIHSLWCEIAGLEIFFNERSYLTFKQYCLGVINKNIFMLFYFRS